MILHFLCPLCFWSSYKLETDLSHHSLFNRVIQQDVNEGKNFLLGNVGGELLELCLDLITSDNRNPTDSIWKVR